MKSNKDGVLLQRDLAEKAKSLFSTTPGAPPGSRPHLDQPPPRRATVTATIGTGEVGEITLLGTSSTQQAFNPGPPVSGDVPVYWTAGTEVSADRGDDPVRRGQWEVMTSESLNDAITGLPSGSLDCGCGACYPGVPVAEGDSFIDICECVNRSRNASFPTLRVKIGSSPAVAWQESGGLHKFQYGSNGIWQTPLFDGPVCTVDEVEYQDQYYYELEVTLTGSPAVFNATVTLKRSLDSSDCELIEISWCYTGSQCDFGCLCPWFFKRSKPFTNVLAPDECNLCVSSKPRPPGLLICTTGCPLPPHMAITIPPFDGGVSSVMGEGDMVVYLKGYQGQTEWPDTIELPSCYPLDGSDEVQIDDATRTEDTTVLLPYGAALSGTSWIYSAWWNDEGECGDPACSLVRVYLECTFDEEENPIVDVIAVVCWAAAAVGPPGSQAGLIFTRYHGTIPRDDFCSSAITVTIAPGETVYNATICGAGFGAGSLVEGDAQVPETLVVRISDPQPANADGSDGSKCGGDLVEDDACDAPACVWVVVDMGDGIHIYQVSDDPEDPTCDPECGECYVSCGFLYEHPEFGDASSHAPGTKLSQACLPPPEEEDTITAEFTGFEGPGACPCAVTTITMCNRGDGVYVGTVVLCGITYTVSYYEDTETPGLYHFDGGPQDATSELPTQGFDLGGVTEGCTGIQVFLTL